MRKRERESEREKARERERGDLVESCEARVLCASRSLPPPWIQGPKYFLRRLVVG